MLGTRPLPRRQLEPEVVDLAIGYSRTDIDNLEGQADDAYKTGQYALGNLLYIAGAERHDGRRTAVGHAARCSGIPMSARDSSSSSRSGTTSRRRSEVSSHEQHAFASSRHRPGRDRPGRGRPGRGRPRPGRARTECPAAADGTDAERRGDSGGRGRGLQEVPGPQGRQERRLHPGAGQGRPEPVRDRGGDRRRQGLSPPATRRPRCRSSRSRRSSRWPR